MEDFGVRASTEGETFFRWGGGPSPRLAWAQERSEFGGYGPQGGAGRAEGD